MDYEARPLRLSVAMVIVNDYKFVSDADKFHVTLAWLRNIYQCSLVINDTLPHDGIFIDYLNHKSLKCCFV